MYLILRLAEETLIYVMNSVCTAKLTLCFGSDCMHIKYFMYRNPNPVMPPMPLFLSFMHSTGSVLWRRLRRNITIQNESIMCLQLQVLYEYYIDTYTMTQPRYSTDYPLSSKRPQRHCEPGDDMIVPFKHVNPVYFDEWARGCRILPM